MAKMSVGRKSGIGGWSGYGIGGYEAMRLAVYCARS